MCRADELGIGIASEQRAMCEAVEIRIGHDDDAW